MDTSLVLTNDTTPPSEMVSAPVSQGSWYAANWLLWHLV